MNPPSPRLGRFLRYAAQQLDDPSALDEAADLLRSLSDKQLALICGEEPGARVRSVYPSLAYSSTLRRDLANELDDLELNLPDSAACEIAEVLRGA